MSCAGRWLLLVLLTALASAGCRCNADAVIAHLERLQGAVERDVALHPGVFLPASRGAEFRLGDALKTGPGASALLALDDGSRVSLQADTLLRFSLTPPDQAGRGLEVETGVAELEVGTHELRLHTRFGSAVIESGTRLQIRPQRELVSFVVLVGLAHFKTPEGLRDLGSGDTLNVALAGAADEPAPREPEARADAPAGAATEPERSEGKTAGAAGGGSDAVSVDLTAAAGSSFVVHDPRPPTSIRFTLAHICERGWVAERLQGSTQQVLARARGAAAESLPFPTGEHRYVVRCVDPAGAPGERVASGIVTVVKDAGSRVLSRVPPLTRVDMDGRSYTITYQNLLPKLIVRWQNAPRAASYELRVESRSGKRMISSAQPVYTFAAGQLPEGDHSLQFLAGQQSSPLTKLGIRFENAAPTARILSPRDGAFTPAAAVTVSGIAAPGWSVSAAGHELALDDQARFSEDVTLPASERALPIRFDHPRRGTHYYLRRAAGASL